MDIFNLLVHIHSKVNLDKCLRHVNNGRILNDDGEPYDEGEPECDYYKGFLIFANGDTLVDKLYENEVMSSKPEEFVGINNNAEFLEYFLKQKGNDGAYIYDRKNGKMMRIIELKNDPNKLPNNFRLEDKLPNDFVSYKGDISADEIGLKTRLAVRVPAAYTNTEAFQIKRSAYTDFGMGKVTHFNKDGLLEEFFFRYDHIKGIIGVNRRYQINESNELVKVAEKEKEMYKKLELVA